MKGRRPYGIIPLIWLVLFAVIPAAALSETDAQDLRVFIERARTRAAEANFSGAVNDLKFVLRTEPDNREARYLLGKTYLDMGQGAFAEKEFRRAQELGTKGLNVLLAESLLQQGRYADLIEQFPVGSSLTSADAAQLHSLRGTAYLGLEQTDAAAQEFADALRKRPETTRAIVGQATIAERAGDTEKARALLEQAVALWPDDASVWSAIGRLEYRAGNLAAAEEAYSKAMANSHNVVAYRFQRVLIRIERDDIQGAGEDIAELKKISSGHPDVSYVEGRLRFREGRFAEARDRLVSAARSPRYAAEVDFYLGTAHFALGSYEQAVGFLERYSFVNPGSRTAPRILAYTRLALGDLQEAERILSDMLRTQPDDVELLRLMAQVKIKGGDRQAAHEYLARAAQLEPSAPGTQAHLGLNLLHTDRSGEAMEALEQAFAPDAPDLSSGIVLITGYLQSGDYDRAIEKAKILQKGNPGSASPWTLMGIAYGSKGDFDQSKQAFEKALEVTPGEPSAAGNLAALALKEGKIDKARGYYEQSLAHFPGYLKTWLKLADLEQRTGNQQAYLEALTRAMEANPRALEPRLKLAQFYTRLRQPEEGIATLRDVEAMHGDDPRFLSTLGWLQLMAEQPSSALRSFGRRVEVEPDSAEARYYLANVYTVVGDTTRFEEVLFKALRMDPNHSVATPLIRAYVDQGASLNARAGRIAKLKRAAPDHPEVVAIEASLALQQGNFDTAQTLFEAGRERFPDENRWVVGMSVALTAQGRGREAVSVLTRWLEGHPKDPVVLLTLANTFLKQKRPADALSTFRQLAELRPNDARVLNNLAWLQREENPKEALAHAERAVELTQGADPKPLDTLGVLLLESGETGRALEVLRQAVRKNPLDPTISYHYAQAMEKSGQSDEATVALRRALASQMTFPERAEADAMFERLRKK